MSLFERLVGIENSNGENPKIGIHAFMGALWDWQDTDPYSRADIITDFNVRPEDEADLDFIKSKYQASADKPRFFRKVKNVLYAGEDDGQRNMNDRATFVAYINSIG